MSHLWQPVQACVLPTSALDAVTVQQQGQRLGDI